MKELNKILLQWNNQNNKDYDLKDNILKINDVKNSFIQYNMYNLDSDDDCEKLRQQIRNLSIPVCVYDEDEDEWIDTYERFNPFNQSGWPGYSYWGDGSEESMGPGECSEWINYSEVFKKWKNEYPQKFIPAGYWNFLKNKYDEIFKESPEELGGYKYHDLLASVTFIFDSDPVDDVELGDLYAFFINNEYEEINRIEDGWGYNYLFQQKADVKNLVYMHINKKGHGIYVQFLAYGIPERL